MSKYVNPTGPGYAGTYGVRHASIPINLGMLDVDWDFTEPVFATSVADGIALVQGEVDAIGCGMALNRSRDPVLSIHSKACSALGVGEGDDVRVYQREAGGLLLVDADDDPRVGGER